MSIHGFDRKYNASIGGEYGITRSDRTTGIALVFKEDLNQVVRHQELIPSEVIDTYLSKLFNRMVAEERIKPSEREARFRDALLYGSLEGYIDSKGLNSLFLGFKIEGKKVNRPHTYTSTIIDLYATQKMREGDYSMNIMTNAEDGIRAFEIKDGVAVPLRVIPDNFEGLFVNRYFELDGVEMPKVDVPYAGEVKIGNIDVLRKIVDGRVPIFMYCESQEEIPNDTSEIHEITPLGYIPINTCPDGRDGRIDVQRRHYIARV
ncbi:hypothetical protein HYX12_02210 [Candidatus Woesearchaeota archaeon]|nr:hypothetical protein [Candidatus Woesearchaeota archaeon]